MRIAVAPILAGLLVATLSAAPVVAQPDPGARSPALLIRNVRIFDGRRATLTPGSVLVAHGRIARIATGPITPAERTTTIDGGGRVLMPGMIDAHVHTLLSLPIPDYLNAPRSYLALRAAESLRRMLDRGFTTVRDLSGSDSGYVRAIREGLVDGPRLLLAGRGISQTSGHGDLRTLSDPHPREGRPDLYQLKGIAVLADGVPAVTAAAREELRRGAHFLKLMAGGGISTPHDPIDVVQYTPAELRAAVEAAENWGTYVTVHAYTPRAIRNAVEAGVRCIEHGHLMDEKAARLMAKRDVYLVPHFVDPDAEGRIPAYMLPKRQAVLAGQEEMMRLIERHDLKVGFGTDLLFSREAQAQQSQRILDLLRWFEPVEILRQLTSTGGEIVALSGPRNPHGRLGVIEEGATADLLLVDGNPLEDLSLLGDPERNLVLIVKGGEVHKNSLP